MGALFRHPVAHASWSELRAAWGIGGPPLLLAVQDGEPVDAAARPRGAAVVIGSEARGVRPEWEGWGGPAQRVTIPMRPGAESLNAAVAAGILLFELTRGA